MTCPACAVHLHQIALLTASLERQTDACAAMSARLAERDHWIKERIAGERRTAEMLVGLADLQRVGGE